MKAWSKYQNSIFDFCANRDAGNAIVEAVAGSGKSTTIVECTNRLPSTCSSILLAFNKSIADELKLKGVNARTFHSLTYSPVTRFKNTRNIEANKLRKLVDKHFSGDEAFKYGTFIIRLVGLARQAGIGCLIDDVQANWLELVSYNDLELETEGAELGTALELASKLLAFSNASQMVDFDDLLYLSVKEGLSLPKYDFVFIDEAQDTNAIQRALLRKILKPNSRIVAVGDPSQAIYGFRGADSNSMKLIENEFNCIKLPLNVSYRCPTSVVQYARQWVSHIEPASGAPAGSVQELGLNWGMNEFAPNDLIVCRTTKPLIALGYRLLKARIPARILGREIGQGLISLIGKLNAKGIDNLIIKLNAWSEREVEKALVRRLEDKVEQIQDKRDAILCLIEGMVETNRTIPALIAIIEQLFSPGSNVVTLATIHKAKGLEARKVFWLNSSQCPAKWARQDWQAQQEINLCYVATTRAQETLVLIEEKRDMTIH